MDPLSISASIITLLGVCSMTAKTFSRILRLKDAPPLVHALNNEISDLQLGVADIKEYVEQIKPSRANTPIVDARILRICSLATVEAQEKVEELNTLLTTRILKNSGTSGGKLEVKYVVFAREFERLRQLQADIRYSRQRIANAVVHIGMKKTTAIEILIKDLYLASSRQIEILNGAAVLINHQAPSLPIARSLPAVSELAICDLMPSKQGYLSASGIEVPAVHISGSQPGHQRIYQQRRANRHIKTYLGTIFIGYSARPVVSWHQRSCSRKATTDLTVTYIFPFWLFCYAILLYIRYNCFERITFSLSVTQFIPDGHLVWVFLQTGNVVGMKKLVQSGQISLRARDASDSSILWQAVSYGHLEVVKLLLQLGADPFEDIRSASTPYKHAWYYILSRIRDPQWNEEARLLFPDPDFDELYGFDSVHKAVLGLTGDCQVDGLASFNTLNLDDEDQNGRTPLSWAASMGDATAVQTLLAGGADCNRGNRNGTSPIMFAARKSSLCFNILLRAGANVLVKNKFQYTSLHIAVESYEPKEGIKIVESLLDSGAIIDTRAANGRTALHHALSPGKEDTGIYLIKRGADIMIQDDFRNNALCYSALYNLHSAVKLLLEKNADHTDSIVGRGSFMHMIAESADAETLRLLAHGNLRRRDINIKNSSGLTTLQVGLQRDMDLEWKEAFLDFLKAVDEDQPL